MVPFSQCWNKKKLIYAHHLKINHSATTTKSTLFIRKNTHTYREVMLEAGFSTAVQHSRWHCTVASGVTMKLTVTLFITVYLTFSHLSDATRAPCLNCVTLQSVVSFWFFLFMKICPTHLVYWYKLHPVWKWKLPLVLLTSKIK